MTHFEMKRRPFGLGLILTVGSLLGHGVGSEALVRTHDPYHVEPGALNQLKKYCRYVE